MKTTFLLGATLLATLGLASAPLRSQACPCQAKEGAAQKGESTKAPATPGVSTAVISVEGMKCGGCASKIASAVRALTGVQGAEVSHTEKRAVVRYKASQVKAEAIAEAIAKLGYKVKVVKAS
ncbi:MAG: heavy-metal-associated domain-containing protein [Deltaproteobacteria bacterium]|nr:heavy-metal-associated domain-containing protein [Deltaproteobacteria bacterium]